MKQSVEITQGEFNYLLPAIRSKLFHQGDRFYFIGTSDEIKDMRMRKQGYYW